MLNPHANPAQLTCFIPFPDDKGAIQRGKGLAQAHTHVREKLHHEPQSSFFPSHHAAPFSLCLSHLPTPAWLTETQALGAPVSVQPSKSFTQQRRIAVSVLASASPGPSGLCASLAPHPLNLISVWLHLACFQKGHEEDERTSADQGLKHQTKAKSRHKGAGEAGSV